MPIRESAKARPVLYVEDDENDVFFMQRAWKAAGLPNALDIARDGKEALDYFANAQTDTLPSLILLDLNLPRRHGLDVLKWIRQQPVCCTVPIVIFTSSRHDEDVHKAYRLGANAYLVKPPRVEEFQDLIKALTNFWLQRNFPPPDPAQFEQNAGVISAR